MAALSEIGAGFINRAEFADFSRPHIGVGLQRCAFEPLSLNGTSRLDPLPHFGAGFAGALAAEFFKGHTRHFDVNIYPVHQWAGYFLLISFDHRDGAGAFFDRVAKITAGTGVHAGNQGKIGRISQRASRAKK